MSFSFLAAVGRHHRDSVSRLHGHGGVNPVTGVGGTAEEQVMWGVGALLNAWGLFGSIYTGGTKGTGAVVDDTIKALPAPRQIDASWSASTYNEGGLMIGVERVFYRHGPDSGFANVSKLSQGTSVKDVSSYVDNALRYGRVTPNGPGGHVIEYNAGKVIGTNVSSAPTSTIKINVRDCVIQTAFPY